MGFFSRLTGRRGDSAGSHEPAGRTVPPFMPASATGAERLAASLPGLIVQAERIAMTVATGQHGRRMAGAGETFWQYRPALPGEAANRIDWRQSARTRRAYVRETEAETAQTVCLWCDLSPSMDWSSGTDRPTKRERAILLLLAVACLLERGGERVQLLTPQGPAALPPGAGRIATRIALALPGLLERNDAALPAPAAIPRFSRLVMASDFLCLPDRLHALLRHLAARPAPTHLLQIIDPAERDLPYKGRTRFVGTEHEPDLILPHVESLRPAYDTLFQERQAELRRLASGASHTLLTHVTDQPAAPALFALSGSLAGSGSART